MMLAQVATRPGDSENTGTLRFAALRRRVQPLPGVSHARPCRTLRDGIDPPIRNNQAAHI